MKNNEIVNKIIIKDVSILFLTLIPSYRFIKKTSLNYHFDLLYQIEYKKLVVSISTQNHL